MTEYYIPYKFYDSKEPYDTTVYCRGVGDDTHKSFKLHNSPYIIVEPFPYENSDEDSIIDTLQRVFRTTHVTSLNGSGAKYIIKDYDITDFNEDDYKYSKIVGDYYTSMIVMNKKRFFNLFTKDGVWTDQRTSDYDNAKKHHIIITYNKTSEHLVYKYIDESDFQILTSKKWKELIDECNIDIIFTDLTKKTFEEYATFEVPNRIDFASIHECWLVGYQGLYDWYKDNIEDLYRLSFISSRNISDLVKINTRSDWKKLADDILLSVSMVLYNSATVDKFETNYCVPGKYKDVYVYHLGDILLKFMELSNSSTTVQTWKVFRDLGRWTFVITDIFNRFLIEPLKFDVPDQCFYMDERFIYTYEPIDANFSPAKKIDYMIALCNGSYITFDSKTKKSVFKGIHPAARPMFPAAKKAIENYMLCNARNFDVNIEAITDMIDKNKTSLSIPVTLTKYNMESYRGILDKEIADKFDLGDTKKEHITVWMATDINKISCVYDPDISNSTSSMYIRELLYSLEAI